MLRILGPRTSGYCDKLSRRSFLSIGGLALGGLAMPDLLRAASASPQSKSTSGGLGHKALIMIYLPGGPPHQDTFDLKPDAPAEIRGEFRPIKTNVNGIEICELMPKLAKMADKYAIIRSLVGARDEHSSHLCLSGYTYNEFRQGKWPS